MDAFFSYRDGHNFGSTANFCLIPHYLQLHNNNYGHDVLEMDVEVFLRPPLEHQALTMASESMAKKGIEPSFKFIKSGHKLKVAYASRFFYLRQSAASSGVECQRFKDHYEEFKGVILKLGPKIATVCDFDYKKLLQQIESMADTLPANDSELLKLRQCSAQYRTSKLLSVDEKVPISFTSASIPNQISIKHFGNEIGHFGNGFQFISGIYGEFELASMLPFATTATPSSTATLCLLAVLHTFTPEGNYLATDVTVIPRDSNNWEVDRDAAADKLNTMLQSLPNVIYGSVSIRPFQFHIGPELFGLIDTSSEEDGDSVTLVPNNWYFQQPWNGDFQT